LKIPDQILDLALEKLVLVDLPGNVEEAFNHWLTASDILEASKDLGVEIQNWYVLDDSIECYEGFLRTLEFVGDNATHVLVRNFGRCEDWSSFDSFITTGLVNSTSVLLKKQQQLVIQTQEAHDLVAQSVIIAWIIPVITLLGCIAVLLLSKR
jgi:hypothetical protein